MKKNPSRPDSFPAHARPRSTGTLVAILAVIAAHVVSPSQLQASQTPPMGWNSWNWHGKPDITETIVRETVDAMVAHGLKDAGYDTVVVDGGWRATHLGPDGELLSHPQRFPGGIKALADYAHARGLRFGVHIVPGRQDCGGDTVGGWGREAQHLAQLTEWGIDFIKLDLCRFGPGLNWDEATIESTYRLWSDLIARNSRPIVFSISAYTFRPWYPEVCSMARTTYDIDARVTGGGAFERTEPENNFLSVMTVANINNRAASFAGNGYWNDPDMLVTGHQGLSDAEQEAHFSLWCVMTSPLFLGNDPRHMSKTELALVTNRTAIAINQDPTEQGRRIVKAGALEIWVKRLADGRRAVLLLNRGSAGYLRAEADLATLLGAPDWELTDVYSGERLTAKGGLELDLDSRQSRFFLAAPIGR